MSSPITVPILSRDVVEVVREIAKALPYRSAIGVDPERVVWIEVGGAERIGVAFTSDDPDGPHWMIAMLRLDGRKVTRASLRQTVDMVAGSGVAWELAPALESAPQLTLVRARAT